MIIAKQDRKRLLGLAVAGALALAVSPLVSAATVPVSNGGSLYLSETTTGTGSSPFGNISAIAVPGNYTYSDSWSSAQTSVVPTTTSGFYDDFVFTVAAGQLDSVTSSVSLGQMLGISGMQVRLYDYNANGEVAPLLTTPAAGSAFDAWSSTVAFPGGSTTVDVPADHDARRRHLCDRSARDRHRLERGELHGLSRCNPGAASFLASGPAERLGSAVGLSVAAFRGAFMGIRPSAMKLS